MTTLLEADDSPDRQLEHVQQLRERVAAAEGAMERLRRALDAGWDPRELREQYNAAASEKRSAEAMLLAASGEHGISREELESYIDQFGDVATALDRADPE